MALRHRKCVPCEGGVAPLNAAKTKKLLAELSGWTAKGGRLRKREEFADFEEAMEFVNRVANLAEREGHHPDFCVHYNRVDFTLWTHAIGGLSENDFILAAKIDALS